VGNRKVIVEIHRTQKHGVQEGRRCGKGETSGLRKKQKTTRKSLSFPIPKMGESKHNGVKA